MKTNPASFTETFVHNSFSIPHVDSVVPAARLAHTASHAPRVVDFGNRHAEERLPAAFPGMQQKGQVRRVNVRVRNVVVTVHASTASNAMSDRDAGQIELERRVAEDVAATLE